jgi:hypothetical protein
MDFNVESYRTRSGRSAKRLVLLPDADVSDAANDSESEEEQLPHSQDDTETDESGDDDVPILPIFPKPAQQVKKATDKEQQKFKWMKKTYWNHLDTEWKGEISEPPAEMRPIEYFQQFFPQDLIQHITAQTNLYAVQNKSAFRTNMMEIEQYLGILLKMGIIGMPQKRMYWSRAMRFPPIADTMSRDRFELINKSVHFNDNNTMVKERENKNYDPYHKVRPILDTLRRCCLKVEPEECMSVDEQMIPFKGIYASNIT